MIHSWCFYLQYLLKRSPNSSPTHPVKHNNQNNCLRNWYGMVQYRFHSVWTLQIQKVNTCTSSSVIVKKPKTYSKTHQGNHRLAGISEHSGSFQVNHQNQLISPSAFAHTNPSTLLYVLAMSSAWCSGECEASFSTGRRQASTRLACASCFRLSTPHWNQHRLTFVNYHPDYRIIIYPYTNAQADLDKIAASMSSETMVNPADLQKKTNKE